MRATNKTKTIPPVESVLRQQPSESAIDATLEDSFPAGDPPSWTLGVEATAPGADFSRGLFFIVEPNREQLGKIAALIDSGVIRPVIAETIPLAKARQAFERGVAGHTRGKLVLQVAAGSKQPA